MSLFLVMIVAACLIITLGVVLIIIGTVMIRKDFHRNLGAILRIMGYAVLLPIAVLIFMFLVIRKI